MDQSRDEEAVFVQSGRRFWRPALVTIFLGVVGSAFWELLARPGLSSAGRFLLTVLTLGSTSIRDEAYSSAALNPFPVPSLVLLIALASVPCGMIAGIGVYRGLLRRPLRRAADHAMAHAIDEAGKQMKLTAQAESLEMFKRRRRVIYRMSVLGLAMLLLAILAAGSIINQAVMIRRTFEADLAICAPFLSDTEEEEVRAHFASVTNRRDYMTIEATLRAVAAANHVTLRQVSLW